MLTCSPGPLCNSDMAKISRSYGPSLRRQRVRRSGSTPLRARVRREFSLRQRIEERFEFRARHTLLSEPYGEDQQEFPFVVTSFIDTVYGNDRKNRQHNLRKVPIFAATVQVGDFQ